MGWITPTVLSPADSITLEADGQTYYAITADGTLSSATDAKDVWYLENRQQIGWDASLPAHGMLITKVHYNKSAWEDNEVNNGTTLYYDIVEADGLSPKYKTAGITFPGAKNVRSVNLVDSCTLMNISEQMTDTLAIVSFNFTKEADSDDSADNVIFYDTFESDREWIITDNSTTTSFNMQISWILDVDAVYGRYYLVSGFDSSAARDAWAIMRNGVSLEAGQEYTMSAYVYALGYNVADQIQFTVGSSSDIFSQTQVVLDIHEKYESWTLVTAKFKPAADGLYHFGIHHCTQALDVNAIAVDEFMIMESVDDKIPVTGISLDLAGLELFVGTTYQLTATITPDSATNKNVSWSSSDEDVAMVENGLIVARSKGRAMVTATTEDGNYTASCVVLVVDDTALEDGKIRDEKNGVWKVFEHGTIYVIREGEKYTIDGRKVK